MNVYINKRLPHFFFFRFFISLRIFFFFLLFAFSSSLLFRSPIGKRFFCACVRVCVPIRLFDMRWCTLRVWVIGQSVILNQNELKIQLCWSVIESTLLFSIVCNNNNNSRLIEGHLFECAHKTWTKPSGYVVLRATDCVRMNEWMNCERYVESECYPKFSERTSNQYTHSTHSHQMWIICLDSIITEW